MALALEHPRSHDRYLVPCDREAPSVQMLEVHSTLAPLSMTTIAVVENSFFIDETSLRLRLFGNFPTPYLFSLAQE